MPSIRLHTSPKTTPTTPQPSNPLPNLLQTPSGLAIVELQATINLPTFLSNPEEEEEEEEDSNETNPTPSKQTLLPIGRIVFPDYNPDDGLRDEDDKSWTKRVYLYIGKHQRMTGEVKKLPKPLAVIRKREKDLEGDDDHEEELEIVDVVYWKVLFAMRPEPVGMEAVDTEEKEDED